MPRLKIDGREVEVREGSTILDAARYLGIDIPTLCFAEGHEAQTSCLVCIVKVNGNPNLVPSCARRVEDGMEVESETDEVLSARRTALELLLSDHHGDCVAPCQNTCPARMDIPNMVRQLADGDLRGALVTVKEDIALPAVLGYVCPEVCERNCRRDNLDDPLSVCLMKRHVAEADLFSDAPYVPEKKPDSGKKVAIVGAGPAGLSAAYYLLLDGHACTVIDDQERPGGNLRRDVSEEDLPRKVLDAEIGLIEKLGVTFRMGERVGDGVAMEDLRRDFDAVFVATGSIQEGDGERFGLPMKGKRLDVSLTTMQTPVEGVFAGGDLVRSRRLDVRAVADGKIAAQSVSQWLAGEKVTGEGRAFAVKAGKMSAEEVQDLVGTYCSTERRNKPAEKREGFTADEALAEAVRCLHCDCRSKDDCKLRDYADAYGAKHVRHNGTHRTLGPLAESENLVFERGKCISCGLCIQIARDAGEEIGLAFVGRGFDVRVDVPFNRTWSDALQKSGPECVDACPTGAIAMKDKSETGREVRADGSN